jgi:thioredoxin-disulfide reductase
METYDLIIIGGGCAGYPAAVYAARFNMKTMVIAKEQGGLITTTHLVENYPGFISLSGQELADNLEAHVRANEVPIENDSVSAVEKQEDGYFKISTEIKERTYLAKTVVLATGTKHRHLDVPGEWEFSAKGVSYCATCDSPFFKNKTVAIVGGSDSATKEAMVLAQNCKHVYMLIRSHLKAEPINADRIRKYGNVTLVEGIEVTAIKGSQKVEGVELTREYEGSTYLPLQGVFIAIGQLPQNELALQLGITTNENGEVLINKLSETNVAGVFAAGDLVNTPWKQGIIGAAEGSMAAYSAFEYINRYY